jgi:hypothetical protein
LSKATRHTDKPVELVGKGTVSRLRYSWNIMRGNDRFCRNSRSL